jgi:O-antigen ligase
MAWLQHIYQRYRLQILFTGGVLAFLAVVYVAVAQKLTPLFGLPILLMAGVMAVRNFKSLWFLLVTFLPLSMDLQYLIGTGSSVTFPTDFLCLALGGLILVKMILERKTHLRFFNHPIFWVICAWVLWWIVPAIGSEYPKISFKWIVAHLWMVAGFYFMSVLAFRNQKNMVHMFWLMGVAFTVAVTTIMAIYVGSGRNPFLLRFNPGPFFNDHTVFGGYTSMLVPIFLLFAIWGRFSRTFRVVSFGIMLFLLLGLFFSYSRGAWASLAAGLVLMALWTFRRWLVRLWPVTVAVIAGLIWFVSYSSQNHGSAATASISRKNLSEHVGSITNFQTDYSNAERINRWKCAWEMFKDRPFTGYGPGTYTRVYGDYQKYKYTTPVSTNHGDNGSAHNEILLNLSEAGFFGGITTLLMFLVPIYFGLRGAHRSQTRNVRLLYLGCTFGIIVYFIHSFVNNFLDQDKVGGVFLLMMAVITALDIYPRGAESAQGDGGERTASALAGE